MIIVARGHVTFPYMTHEGITIRQFHTKQHVVGFTCRIGEELEMMSWRLKWFVRNEWVKGKIPLCYLNMSHMCHLIFGQTLLPMQSQSKRDEGFCLWNVLNSTTLQHGTSIPSGHDIVIIKFIRIIGLLKSLEL